jgi:hypothetical protein
MTMELEEETTHSMLPRLNSESCVVWHRLELNLSQKTTQMTAMATTIMTKTATTRRWMIVASDRAFDSMLLRWPQQPSRPAAYHRPHQKQLLHSTQLPPPLPLPRLR